MKKPAPISSGTNHTAVDLGPLDGISAYSMIHPRTGKELRKVFLKEHTGATGTEISLQELAPRTELPYLHKHSKNEETYIILSGRGEFVVDDERFPIMQGSVVRVAPGGVRGFRNDSDQGMLYMVIQSRENSLEEYSSADGTVVG